MIENQPLSASQVFVRRYPIGAEVSDDGTHFRVWAPSCDEVELVLDNAAFALPMSPEPSGYFSLLTTEARAGDRYRFRLDGRGPYPDPASRYQPNGPHGPSEIIDPRAYQWADDRWAGIDAHDQVLYELHIGTFTPEGTWQAAIEHLPALRELGITTIELMPIAEFPGRFGWGYDGVNLFAPTRLYGRPDDVRQFVDRAHALGMGVILDVVYNHFGPDGNYLNEFSPTYFSVRYDNEWGDAINFDDDAASVREFFIANAAYWIDEFHLDGLRLDATQQIFDASPCHILHDISVAVRHAARGRLTYIVAENEKQQSALISDHGIDALWNDDFHHSAVVALTGRREAYYSDYRGVPQEFISAAKYGFLFQGQRFDWQDQPRGSPSLMVRPYHFVHFLENHDQVANSTQGLRVHQRSSPGQMRAMTAVLLLGQQTPLLFQGQEFAASSPFLFFADHNPELARAVAKGRATFLEQFPSSAAARSALPAPEDPQTFERCKLDHGERFRNQEVVALHRDLLALRRVDGTIGNRKETTIDGSVIRDDAFVLRFFSPDQNDRLLVVNLGSDLKLASIADPLVAPVANGAWRMLWSSEDVRYGGMGAFPIEDPAGWLIPAHSAVVLATETE